MKIVKKLKDLTVKEVIEKYRNDDRFDSIQVLIKDLESCMIEDNQLFINLLYQIQKFNHETA